MAISPRSTENTGNFFLGFWEQVTFTEDPLGTPAEFYLGNFADGSLELTREDIEHLGTTFPQVVDFVSPAQAGMNFTGNSEEWHVENFAIYLGQLASAVDDGSAHYLYPAQGCVLQNAFGNLTLKRTRCQDDFILTAKIWKTTGSGSLTLGGGAEVQGTPVEFKGLDDGNGTYGGSASAPLGWLYMPARQT